MQAMTGADDITPEQERELEAREECERQGIDPDEICADDGILAWMVVDREMQDAVAPRLEAIRAAANAAQYARLRDDPF